MIQQPVPANHEISGPPQRKSGTLDWPALVLSTPMSTA